MPLYNQSDTPVSGTITSYQRAELLVMRNSTPPVVECHEVTRTIYPTGEVRDTPTGIIRHTADDMALEIPMIDPKTFEPIPGQTFTAGQFALMGASIYMFLARARDAEAGG